MIDSLLAKLAEIAETEFADVVITSEINMGKLRLYINDESFLEVWFSSRLEGRYAYHWERRHVDDTIYRWDNAKHEVWKNVKTFPHHFHEGKDEKVSESSLPEASDDALRYTLIFVRKFLHKNEIDRTMMENNSAEVMIGEFEKEDAIKEIRRKTKETSEKELIREAIRARKFSGADTLRQGMNLIDFALRINKDHTSSMRRKIVR